MRESRSACEAAREARLGGGTKQKTRTLGAIAWLGVVPTALATIVYFRVIASAGPTFLSLVNYLVPLVALAAGFAAYSEQPTWSSAAALLLVLAGIGIAQARERATA